jgi:hypothetical protein
MRVFNATLHNMPNSPYSQSRYHGTEKDPKETHEDYEKRTWRNRVHANQDGQIFIPPMVFKNCLSNAAKFISMQIPGRGKSTYTKHFEAGILVMEGVPLPINKEEVEGEWLFVPADGVRGGTKRVMKCFPVIHEWEGNVNFYILDETITLEVFEYHLKEAGNFIGIGRFRPRRNGFYGRFQVLNVKEGNL